MFLMNTVNDGRLINISKTKIVIFGGYSRNQHLSLHIAGEKVEIEVFKCLGVLFTKKRNLCSTR